jgi:DNA polymerase-3 subunit epsilon
MRITCIDFETANPFWGSICSVGVAVIEDNKVVKTINMLVKPHSAHGEFNRDNIRVHGIKPEMVKDAPEFNEIYGQIKPYLENGVMAAHNTTFDVNCLKDVLTLYNIPIPSFEYIFTCEIARKSWIGLKNYKLSTVAAFLGHKFHHHDAGEDAMASSQIIIKSMEQNNCTDIHDLAEKIGVVMGTAKAGEQHILTSVKRELKLAERVDVREIVPDSTNFNPGHLFFNKEIVFTGKFSKGITRRQIMQMAANSGAMLSNYVRSRTDFLVQGTVADAGAARKESYKIKKAEKLIESGFTIRIIGEDEFFTMLGA